MKKTLQRILLSSLCALLVFAFAVPAFASEEPPAAPEPILGETPTPEEESIPDPSVPLSETPAEEPAAPTETPLPAPEPIPVELSAQSGPLTAQSGPDIVINTVEDWAVFPGHILQNGETLTINAAVSPDYTVVYIAGGATVTINGNGNAISNVWFEEQGTGCRVTLQDVDFTGNLTHVYASYGQGPGEEDGHIRLVGNNKLTTTNQGGAGLSGVSVWPLVLKAEPHATLDATGAIGILCRNYIQQGGTVNATSNQNGFPGFSMENAPGYSLTLTGGTLTATGGQEGYGLYADTGSGGTLTIQNDGLLTARASGSGGNTNPRGIHVPGKLACNGAGTLQAWGFYVGIICGSFEQNGGYVTTHGIGGSGLVASSSSAAAPATVNSGALYASSSIAAPIALYSASSPVAVGPQAEVKLVNTQNQSSAYYEFYKTGGSGSAGYDNPWYLSTSWAGYTTSTSGAEGITIPAGQECTVSRADAANLPFQLDGGTKYPSLDLALGAIADSHPHEVNVLQTATHHGAVTLDNKNVRFILGGNTLTISAPDASTYGTISVKNSGKLDFDDTGGGALNLTGSEVLIVDSGNARVSNITAYGDNCHGIVAMNNAVVAVTGNVSATGSGATSFCAGALAIYDSTVTIGGSVSSTMYGVESETNSTIAIGHDITVNSNRNEAYGAFAVFGGQVIIDGSVTVKGKGRVYGIHTGEGLIIENGSGGDITVRGGVTATAASGACFGVYAYGNYATPAGRATVNGPVSAVNTGRAWTDNAYGLYAADLSHYSDPGGHIAAKGGVSASAASGWGYGAYARSGGTATVTGNIRASGSEAYGAVVERGGSSTLNGDASATGKNSIAALVDRDSNLTVNGSLTASGADCIGLSLLGGPSEAFVSGNITAAGTGAKGVSVENTYAQASCATINGAVTALIYIDLNGFLHTKEQVSTPTTKAGYFTYTDGSYNTVWVKDPTVAPPPGPGRDNGTGSGGDGGGAAAPAPVKAQSVKTPKTLYLTKGKSVKLPYAVYPENANDKKVTWTVKNKKIATVNAKTGAVKGVKPGKTVVTATSADGKVKANCTVVVAKTATTIKSVKLNKAKATLKPGASLQLTAKPSPAKSTNVVARWKSSKSKVATVDAMGKVTAVAKGKATIIVSVGGKTAKCVVTVK